MRYTVLIADDSKLQRVIVKENLKDIYDVAEASGGQECLDLVEHRCREDRCSTFGYCDAWDGWIRGAAEKAGVRGVSKDSGDRTHYE